MRHNRSTWYVLFLPCALILVTAGCPTVNPGDPLNQALNVVGGTWTPEALKDTGGPTISPPAVTVKSNSAESFDIEITVVDEPNTLEDVTQLHVAAEGEGFLGLFMIDVDADESTDAGTIRVTVVREGIALLDRRFTLEISLIDDQQREGSSVRIDVAFFSASAGEDVLVSVGEEVDLNATFTGATGSPQVDWTQIAGPTVVIANSFAASTTFVPTEPAAYVFRLEAVDPSGVIDVDLVTVVAVDVFTVDAGESKLVTVGEEATLRGLAGGGSGQASFLWTEISDFNVEIQDLDSRIASFVALETGEYEFELTAIDDVSGQVTDRVIHLAVDRLTARANAPDQIEAGETIQLQGQAGGGLFPYAFRWTQVSGPAVEIQDETNQTALATLSSPGTYVFELRVEDSQSATATTQTTVTAETACDVDDDCDDEDACTIDTCDTGFHCAFTGIVCEEDQACREGVCKIACTSDSHCNDAEFCNGTETCVDGLCQEGAFPCNSDAICDEDAEECLLPDRFVFLETFESGIGNWFADNGIWEVGVPSSGPNSAYSGEQLAATVLEGDYADGTSSRLVSPSIQLPAINAEEEIHLRFWHWFAFAATNFGTDSGAVQIREQTAPGQWTTWTNLDTFVGFSQVFTHALVDLSGHTGKKVQIGFLVRNARSHNTSAGWYVDDVTIEVR